MQVIIYVQDSGIPAMVVPTGELDIAQVALKDVPFGKPYKIVDDSTLPPVDEFYNAWTADMSNPDGTGMGAQRWFIQKYDAATVEANEMLTASTAALAALVQPDEADEEATAEYNAQHLSLTDHIAYLNRSITDLAAMRKVQSDELFKFEGVTL